jgi:hypothetical protein
MGLSSKSKVISGLALVTAIVSGCGGGGGASTPASGTPSGGPAPSPGITQGSTVCAAVASPIDTVSSSSVALLGSCEQYEASNVPTRSASEFKSPGGGITKPLTFSGTAYDIDLGSLVAKASIPSATQSNLSSTFGNFAGKRYRITLGDSFADAYDFQSTVTAPLGNPVLTLTNSRFGVFSRFSNLTQGYYGGWAQGGTQGNLPTGSKTFTGYMVGVIGPSSTSSAVGTVVGYSATFTVGVNFAASANPVITSFAITNFGYSVNGDPASPQPVASGNAATTSVNLDRVAKSLSASFSVPLSGTSSAIRDGSLVGSFYGNPGVDITEFVGTAKFVTQDGRNAIGAFGLR